MGRFLRFCEWQGAFTGGGLTHRATEKSRLPVAFTHRTTGDGAALTSQAMPTVLVVADGTWVTNEVRSALSVGSWQIEEISDPRTVTARLDESRVDAVIVDMQVGSKGGMAVVRSIRQEISEVDRPRTVLLLDREADEFLARRAGADASVLKPINAAELRAALRVRPPARSAPGEEGE